MQPLSKISFILHGKTRGLNGFQEKLKKIFSPAFYLDFRITTSAINASYLAVEALKEGTDYLVAVGGDGTVNEVINGYLQAQPNKITPIGIIPLGRGNDLVKSLGLGYDLESLLAGITNSEFKIVDVGQLTFLDRAQENKVIRYFVNIADIGLGGMATQLVRTSPRLLGANLTYLWSILRSLWVYAPQEVELRCPDWTYSGKIMSICMANGKYFASGLAIAPSAIIDDGIAEIVVIGKVGWIDFLKHLPQLKRGEKLIHPEIRYYSTSKCEIFSKIPMPIDMDGEFVGYTPLSLEMIPKSLTFIVPKG